MKKFLLTPIIVIGMLVASATAKAIDYNLYINNVQVTSNNANNVLNNGTVKWNNSTKTLSLYNANIVQTAQTAAISIGIDNADIKIIYYGTNSIAAPANCIYLNANNSTLTIESGSNAKYGTANLTLTGGSGISANDRNNQLLPLLLSHNDANGAFKITTSNEAISASNLIIKNMLGNSNRNVIKSTSDSLPCIVCNALYTGSNVNETYTTRCTNSYPKAMTIEGTIRVDSIQLDLNKQSASMNYIHTPASTLIWEGYLFDIPNYINSQRTIIEPDVAERYHIWVRGVEITSHNANRIIGGTASYDVSTHTLTLENFTPDASGSESQFYFRLSGIYDNAAPLIFYDEQAHATRKICVIAHNKATIKKNSDGTDACFIQTLGQHDVIFEGNGTLEIILNDTNPSHSYYLLNAPNAANFQFNGSGRIIATTNSNITGLANSNVIVSNKFYQAYWTDDYTTARNEFKLEQRNINLAGNNIRTLYIEPAYDLYVAGLRVDFYNQNDIEMFSDHITSGGLLYTAIDNTLRIYNATIVYDNVASDTLCSIIANDLNGNSRIRIILLGTSTLIYNKDTTATISGFSNGVLFDGNGDLKISVNNPNTGAAIGIDGDIEVIGKGKITFETPETNNQNRAISGNIKTTTNHALISGTTEATATLQTSMPTTCTDYYACIYHTNPMSIDLIDNDNLLVWSINGFIGCSANKYNIYTINGINVTLQNGNLAAGTYIVRSDDGVAKITIR